MIEAQCGQHSAVSRGKTFRYIVEAEVKESIEYGIGNLKFCLELYSLQADQEHISSMSFQQQHLAGRMRNLRSCLKETE